MKRNRKGFTLMEMLIVVAIIAILIAVAIPTFVAQLERAREAADLAEIRTVCSELNQLYLFNDAIPANFYHDKSQNRVRACIKCQGKKSGWQTKNLQKEGSGVVICDAVCYAADTEKPYLSIYIDMSTGAFSFNREASVKKPLYNG